MIMINMSKDMAFFIFFVFCIILNFIQLFFVVNTIFPWYVYISLNLLMLPSLISYWNKI